MIKLELHRHWPELWSRAGFLLLEPAHSVNMGPVGMFGSGEDPGPDASFKKLYMYEKKTQGMSSLTLVIRIKFFKRDH